MSLFDRKSPKFGRTARGLLLVLILTGLLAAGLLPALGASRAWAREGSANMAATGEDALGAGPSLDPTPLIAEVYNLLHYNSVKKPDPMALAEDAIQGMLTGLRDYWSAYYTPDAMQAFMTDVQGEFGGVGVRVSEDPDGYLLVANVITGCPADKAGMLAGDLIVAIDGQDIKGLGLAAADQIRGEPGTEVVLTVKRPGVEGTLTFKLVRELIKVTSVDSRLLAGNVGYINVSSFDLDTDQEFDAALRSLAAQGAKSFIIDLRNNPGGLLDTCERMVERFLPERYPYLRVEWTWRTEIVRSRASDGYTPLEGIAYKADGRFPYPVAVLVNGYTASASEIFTAALQEWGVARVFGTRTFGKGCVQTIYSLSNGGGLKVTTATWKTGLAHPIDGQGIVPDEIIVNPNDPAAPDAVGDPGFIPVTGQWVFRRGAQGSDIVNLQMRLTQLGYDCGATDGVFSAATEAALKRFQAAVGLPQTGATDVSTVAALNRARLADHPAGKKAGLTSGQTGSDQTGSGQTRPAARVVTGDPVIDRAIQWLGGQAGVEGAAGMD